MKKIIYLPLYILSINIILYNVLNYKYYKKDYRKKRIKLYKDKTLYFPLYKKPVIFFFPKYVAPKLLTPSIHSLYNIILKEELQFISATNKEPLHFKIGLCIRFYILDLLDELFQIVLPLSNHKLHIIIHISFNTIEFENGTHKIHLTKDKTMDLNEIIQLLLDKLHKLDAKYNILYIHSVHIKIIYGK